MKRLLVLLMAVALTAGFAVTAMATDWSFYGSARMSTFYWNQDEKLAAATQPAGYLFPDGIDGTKWDLQSNARVGARASGGPLGGQFEYGVSSDTKASLRLLYGTYTFGFGGEILVGQQYTPTGDRFYSNQVWQDDIDLLHAGDFYCGRQPSIQFSMRGFEIALVKPKDGGACGATVPDSRDATKTLTAVTDIAYPKVEAKYRFSNPTFFFDIWGGFQTYQVEAVKDFDVTSYVGGLGGGVNLGPAYFRAGGYYAMNEKNYGSYTGSTVLTGTVNQGFAARYDATKNDIIDVKSYAALGVIGAKAGDMVTFELGGGYASFEEDVDGAENDDFMQYYLNCTINIGAGFFIVPEVGVLDHLDSAKKDASGNQISEGKITYAGAKWQINF